MSDLNVETNLINLVTNLKNLVNMKRTYQLMVLAVLTCCCFALLACGGDDNGPVPPANNNNPNDGNKNSTQFTFQLMQDRVRSILQRDLQCVGSGHRTGNAEAMTKEDREKWTARSQVWD